MSCSRSGALANRTILLCVAVVLASGCDASRQPATQPTSPQVIATRAAAETAGPVCAPTGAHAKHAEVKISCESCHPCGGTIGFTTVMTFPAGTTSAGTYDTTTTPPTCNVGCHSPKGSALHPVTWSTAAPLACVACHDVSKLAANHAKIVFPHTPPTRDDCLMCHDMSAHTTGAVIVAGHNQGWLDQASSGFHAFAANSGLDACKFCHGQDLSGGAANVACGQCHDANLPPGVTTWKKNCVMCHGGTDNQTGGPPRTTWGKSAELVRVGAHSVHLQGSAIAGPVACNSCHVVPPDALAAGHVDGQRAEVVFGGIASQGLRPTYDAATATCSATYCHGGNLVGGSNTRPDWTKLDGTQAACGTCHGIPPRPTWGHNYHTGCTWCHYDIANDSGTAITNPALHIDGVVEYVDRNVTEECWYCH
jgi:predicted CxxxxCH...CXXCH cytochrome family protein